MHWKSGILSSRLSASKKGLEKRSGFGLAETFISLMLLTGFLLSACHLLLNLFTSNLLDQTAVRLVDSFQLARQAAVESNSKVIVKPVNNNWSNGWQILSVTSQQERTIEQQQILFTQAELKEAVMFVEQDELSIVFNPNGMTSHLNPLGENGLTFCNASGKGRQLNMLASGQVHITHIKQGCGVHDV